jgi:precorrin-3B methylase
MTITTTAHPTSVIFAALLALPKADLACALYNAIRDYPELIYSTAVESLLANPAYMGEVRRLNDLK